MKLFIILLLILFIPVPLKLDLYVCKTQYTLKLYRFTLISSNKKNVSKKKSLLNKPSKNKEKKLNIKNTIAELYHSRFKPLLNIRMNFEYSFDDAARTAISYGILCEIPPVLNNVLNIVFKVKRYSFDIQPKFENKLILNFKANSIIFLSLAHIIIILVIVLKNWR